MTLWAVVPVKTLGRSKSRLAQVLGQEERRALSASLLIHTLDSLTHATEVERIEVVSSDAEVGRLAAEWGAMFVDDPAIGGLNQVLTVTEKGFGKLTPTKNYPVHNRGSKGVRTYRVNPKTGNLALSKLVSPQGSLVMLSTQGNVVNIPMEQVPIQAETAEEPD